MNENTFTIWCNNEVIVGHDYERDLLLNGVGTHQLLMFDPAQSGSDGASRAALETADIAFGYPEAETVVACPRLRWIQLHSAGYTSFGRDQIKRSLSERGTMVTNSSAVYDEPCAQHLLAMILSLARGLPLALDVQRGDKSWQMNRLRPTLPLLNGQTVLLLGFGAIARRLVEMLRPFDMNLIAVRRAVNDDEPVQTVKTSAVDEFLPVADHVVNILPANEHTKNFLDSERLRKLKPGAIVYNIGRGVTIDQAALIEALNEDRIAAAYLDVTDPEPLPPDHPLWTTPNCYITPHAGGGHTQEQERLVNHFLANLRRFEKNESLLNRVI